MLFREKVTGPHNLESSRRMVQAVASVHSMDLYTALRPGKVQGRGPGLAAKRAGSRGKRTAGLVFCQRAARTAVLLLSSSGCAWSKTLPTTLPTATTSIDYRYQGYTGTIPTEFGKYTAVTTMQIGGNDLTGAIPTGECE